MATINLDLHNIKSKVNATPKPAEKPTDKNNVFNALEVLPDNIPGELKYIENWVVFRAVKKIQKDGSIRWNKPPLQSDGKTHAKPNDSKTWCSFEEAIKAYNTGKFDGIGFVLTKETGYTAGDIDHCIINNQISQEVQNILDDINSYSEISPSGTGIRFLCSGTIPDGLEGNKSDAYELYDSGRYVTITGQHITGTPKDIEENPEAIKRYHQTYIKKASPEEPLFTSTASTEERKRETIPDSSPSPLSVDERVKKLLDYISKNATNSEKIMALWNGETSGDHSAADLALCNHLAYYLSKNANDIDLFFRQSKLFRTDKWDSKHYADGRTYGQGTIEKAIAGTKNTWLDDSKQKTAKQPTPDALKAKAKQILDAQEPCGEFDINILPDSWKNYIEAAMAETAADPMMIVQSLMCSISAMVGKRIYIPNGVSFGDLYPNLWCCSISDSGTFKTTALNKGSRIARRKEAKIYQQISDLEKQKVNLIGKESKDEKENIDKQIRDIETQSPYLSDKATAAALYKELSTGQEGMIQSSELGGWLKKITESSQGDIKETLTDFYDVPDVRSKRTINDNKVIVKLPFITINGVSTVDWIQRNLQQDDVSSGFFARFLLFYPPKNTNRPPPRPIAYDPTRFNLATDTIYMTLETIRNQDTPTIYTLSDEAGKLYDSYYNILWDTVGKEPEQMQRVFEPFLKRWTPYILKIAMITQPFIDSYSTEISPEALEVAKYIVDYAIKSTTYLFKNQLGESEHQMKCRKILELIAKKGGWCKWQQILESRTLDGGSLEYEYVVTTLEESGKININRDTKQKVKWTLHII